MIPKLFISKTPDGCYLRRSIKKEGNVTSYEDTLKRGSYTDLIGAAVKKIPDEFYATKEDAVITFGNKYWPLHFSALQMKELNDVVREHQKEVRKKYGMAKELSVIRNSNRYSLSSLAGKDSCPFLIGGTESDLEKSLANLPEEFFQEGIILYFNYGNLASSIGIPRDKREKFEGIVEMLKEAENIFD
jgi:hypothetical protein